jgi:SAM-dependent methyltransferase
VNWRVKGALDRALGLVPGGRRLQYRLERRIGSLVDLGRECDLQVDDWHAIMARLRGCGIAIDGARIVELGTGRCPTVPVCMYLAGAARVFTLDRERRLEPELVGALVDRLQIHVALIARDSDRSVEDIAAHQNALSHAVGRGTTLMLATGNVVDYRAPADATATALPEGTIDAVVSRSVLEHETPAALTAAFAEAMRILRPGGIVVHTIDCADHYAASDGRRGPLDYLALSDGEWARWNTVFLYQNRLRAKDFVELAREAGFAIEVEQPRRRGSLEGIVPSPRFAAYSQDELAITSFELVARKPA